MALECTSLVKEVVTGIRLVGLHVKGRLAGCPLPYGGRGSVGAELASPGRPRDVSASHS